MSRLRRCELCHQDRDEPLFWVHPEVCPVCPDPIEFPDGAGPRIMPGRDSDRKAKTEALAVLEVRLERTKLPAKTIGVPGGRWSAVMKATVRGDNRRMPSSSPPLSSIWLNLT
jgi:hypothetical protein